MGLVAHRRLHFSNKRIEYRRGDTYEAAWTLSSDEGYWMMKSKRQLKL
jgi:hypothetical protein